MPVVSRLQTELLERDIVHCCNETSVQVLKEDRKRPQTKAYMWFYRTRNDGKTSVILYDYQPFRNGNHAVTYLKDFKNYVHSDGYSGYNKLSGITRVTTDSFSIMLLKIQSSFFGVHKNCCFRIHPKKLQLLRQSTVSLKPKKRTN